MVGFAHIVIRVGPIRSNGGGFPVLLYRHVVLFLGRVRKAQSVIRHRVIGRCADRLFKLVYGFVILPLVIQRKAQAIVCSRIIRLQADRYVVLLYRLGVFLLIKIDIANIVIDQSIVWLNASLYLFCATYREPRLLYGKLQSGLRLIAFLNWSIA